jgi:hypothetical protein
VRSDIPEFNEKMAKLGKALNLKPHAVGLQGKEIVGPCDIEGHKGRVCCVRAYALRACCVRAGACCVRVARVVKMYEQIGKTLNLKARAVGLQGKGIVGPCDVESQLRVSCARGNIIGIAPTLRCMSGTTNYSIRVPYVFPLLTFFRG